MKPVNEEELNRVLTKKILDELTVQWRSEREHQILKETISESRHIIKRDFLKNIIETEEPEEVDDRVEFSRRNLPGNEYKTGLMSIITRKTKNRISLQSHELRRL